MAFYFLALFGLAQTPYFQQQVNYTISVSLNDTSHTLKGNCTLNYINRSPHALAFIYFHLWPNAYRNNNSALVKQLLLHNKKELYFSDAALRGYMDSLDFTAEGRKLTLEPDKTHPDICKVLLARPLAPGDSLTLTTPFFVKIPDAMFSRMGHTNQAYYITQWYPKPAVYDADGWHPMPYLDQGEFYSEFGNYDVRITLPQNYYLAATGNRVDAGQEEAFVAERVKQTHALLASGKRGDDTFPPSSSQNKTVRFVQQQVHDFAWFADKRFYVLRGNVTLPASNRTVQTWAYVTGGNLFAWRNAIHYVNRSTLFYSEHVGAYPYDHVTAVDGTIMAGGGMEYPNITVIGTLQDTIDLEITIAHEVGHNWFYGMLASNERRYPFLDEGINSFYEMRYMRRYYPLLKMTSYIRQDSTFGLMGFNKVPRWKEKELAYMYSHRQRNDQPLDLPSDVYSETNYGTIVYSKTPVVLDYLMAMTGEAKLDSAMQAYFSRYCFKHPSPNDFYATLAQLPNVDTAAVVKHLISSTNKIDYKLKSVKFKKGEGYRVKIKNKTGVVLPFELGVATHTKPLVSQWHSGFKGTRTIVLKVDSATHIKIDPNNRMPDFNRRNNAMRTSGLFKKAKPLQFDFLTKLNNPEKNQIGYLPAAGHNAYNGLMLGIVLHNYSLLRKRVEFLAVPMYGFRSKSPAGYAEINLNLFPKRVFSQVTAGCSIKHFAYDVFNTGRLNQNNGTDFQTMYFGYSKLTQYLEMDLKKPEAGSPLGRVFTLVSNLLFTDSLNTTPGALALLNQQGPRRRSSVTQVNQAIFAQTNKRAIDPYSFSIQLQQAGDMSKLFGNFTYKYTLGLKHSIVVDVFAGTFLSGSKQNKAYYAFRPSGYNGSNDYLFDGSFIGRNESNGLASSQFLDRDGGLKVWTVLSGTPSWMASVKLKSPRIHRLPLKVYAAALFCDANLIAGNPLLWDAGLQMDIGGEYVEVFVPLAYSNYIQDKLELNNIGFLNRIRFTVNLHKLIPRTFIRSKFVQ